MRNSIKYHCHNLFKQFEFIIIPCSYVAAIMLGVFLACFLKDNPIYRGSSLDKCNFSTSIDRSKKIHKYLWQYNILKTEPNNSDIILPDEVFAERNFQESILKFDNQIITDYSSSHIVISGGNCEFIERKSQYEYKRKVHLDDNIQTIWMNGCAFPADTLCYYVEIKNDRRRTRDTAEVIFVKSEK